MNMKITYDPYADAMYIFAGKIFKSAPKRITIGEPRTES